MSIKTKAIFTGTTIAPFRDLADKIKDSVGVVDATISETTPRAVYENNLPEGVTMVQVGALSKYNHNYVQAARVAVAEISADLFAKDKELTTTTASLGYFNKGDTVDIRATRHASYRVPGKVTDGEEPARVDRLMVLSTDVNFRAQSGTALRNEISEQAAGFFSK